MLRTERNKKKKNYLKNETEADTQNTGTDLSLESTAVILSQCSKRFHTLLIHAFVADL